jgi:hypothetical protein
VAAARRRRSRCTRHGRVAAAAADLTWRRDGDLVSPSPSAGGITYQHSGPQAWSSPPPLATVSTARATFHLRSP